jgi:peptidoglycan hydrolase-like protein with peptidoglycan-binding domain
LQQGSRGSDVTELQQALQNLHYLPTAITPSTFYGPNTQKAVQAFQCAQHLVCAGSSQATGYGTFGPKTRNVMNQVLVSTPSTGARQIKTREQLLAQLAELLQILAQLQAQLAAKKAAGL